MVEERKRKCFKRQWKNNYGMNLNIRKYINTQEKI